MEELMDRKWEQWPGNRNHLIPSPLKGVVPSQHSSILGVGPYSDLTVHWGGACARTSTAGNPPDSATTLAFITEEPTVWSAWSLATLTRTDWSWHPCMLPAPPAASEGHWRDSTIPMTGTRDTMAWYNGLSLLDNVLCYNHEYNTRREWCTRRLSVPEVSYTSLPAPCLFKGETVLHWTPAAGSHTPGKRIS